MGLKEECVDNFTKFEGNVYYAYYWTSNEPKMSKSLHFSGPTIEYVATHLHAFEDQDNLIFLVAKREGGSFDTPLLLPLKGEEVNLFKNTWESLCDNNKRLEMV